MQLNTGNVFCKRGSVSLFQIFILMFSLVAFSYMIGEVDGFNNDHFEFPVGAGNAAGDAAAAEESVISDVQWEGICAKLKTRGQAIAEKKEGADFVDYDEIKDLGFLGGIKGLTDTQGMTEVPQNIQGEITETEVVKRCRTNRAALDGLNSYFLLEGAKGKDAYSKMGDEDSALFDAISGRMKKKDADGNDVADEDFLVLFNDEANDGARRGWIQAIGGGGEFEIPEGDGGWVPGVKKYGVKTTAVQLDANGDDYNVLYLDNGVRIERPSSLQGPPVRFAKENGVEIVYGNDAHIHLDEIDFDNLGEDEIRIKSDDNSRFGSVHFGESEMYFFEDLRAYSDEGTVVLHEAGSGIIRLPGDSYLRSDGVGARKIYIKDGRYLGEVVGLGDPSEITTNHLRAPGGTEVSFDYLNGKIFLGDASLIGDDKHDYAYFDSEAGFTFHGDTSLGISRKLGEDFSIPSVNMENAGANAKITFLGEGLGLDHDITFTPEDGIGGVMATDDLDFLSRDGGVELIGKNGLKQTLTCYGVCNTDDWGGATTTTPAAEVAKFPLTDSPEVLAARSYAEDWNQQLASGSITPARAKELFQNMKKSYGAGPDRPTEWVAVADYAQVRIDQITAMEAADAVTGPGFAGVGPGEVSVPEISLNGPAGASLGADYTTWTPGPIGTQARDLFEGGSPVLEVIKKVNAAELAGETIDPDFRASVSAVLKSEEARAAPPAKITATRPGKTPKVTARIHAVRDKWGIPDGPIGKAAWNQHTAGKPAADVLAKFDEAEAAGESISSFARNEVSDASADKKDGGSEAEREAESVRLAKMKPREALVILAARAKAIRASEVDATRTPEVTPEMSVHRMAIETLEGMPLEYFETDPNAPAVDRNIDEEIKKQTAIVAATERASESAAAQGELNKLERANAADNAEPSSDAADFWGSAGVALLIIAALAGGAYLIGDLIEDETRDDDKD